MCLGHLRVEEAAPNTSSRGILLDVVGVADGPNSSYAPEKKPEARDVAQAKAKSDVESRALLCTLSADSAEEVDVGINRSGVVG